MIACKINYSFVHISRKPTVKCLCDLCLFQCNQYRVVGLGVPLPHVVSCGACGKDRVEQCQLYP